MNKFVVSGSMWRYFYRRSVIVENQLYLTEGIFHEDEEFVVKFLSYSERILYKRHLVYNHLIRSNSTVNNKNRKHRLKLLDDIVTVISNLNEHRRLFTDDSSVYRGISKKLEQLTVSLFLRMRGDRLRYDETEKFVGVLKKEGLFPIRIKVAGIKF